MVLMSLPFALPVAASNAATPKEILILSLEDSNFPSARLTRRIKGRESVQLLLIGEVFLFNVADLAGNGDALNQANYALRIAREPVGFQY